MQNKKWMRNIDTETENGEAKLSKKLRNVGVSCWIFAETGVGY
jgi:hypothetical protein